ncbi:MAG: MATE family efflux transporter [Solobacterium sp.]|jgi:putative MATE family efflux protein|nr:MATE family efflux transporter [Solobacterium sp.]
MMKQHLQKFICSRAFMKAVLAVTVPLMLQQLIASSVNLVDNLMVGMLGDAALAGVAAVNRYYMIALYGTTGLCAAASVFIAQYCGANEQEHMKESFRTMILVACVIMVVFSMLAVCFPSVIVGFFTSDAAVIAQGVSYIRVVAWSFIPTAVTLSVYNAMRSVGETKVPLRCSVVAVLTNTFLNWCFIFGNCGMPKMGVAGAALATLISRVLELTLSLVALYRTPFDFKTKLTELFVIPKEIFKKIIVKAAPLMLNEVLWSSGMAMLFKFYSYRGSDVMSAYSISTTVSDIFFTLFAGMAAASTVFISQPLGADKLDQAKENGYHLIGFSFLLALIFGVAMFSASYLVPYLYSQVSMETKMMSQNFLRIQSVMFWIYMITTQCYFTLRAGGDMKHTLIMDSGFMWLINIPIVAFVTYCTGFSYIWIYLFGQMTDLVKLAVSYHLVKKEKWVVNLTAQRDI